MDWSWILLGCSTADRPHHLYVPCRGRRRQTRGAGTAVSGATPPTPRPGGRSAAPATSSGHGQDRYRCHSVGFFFCHKLRYQVPHHPPHAQRGPLRHLPPVLDTDRTGTGATQLAFFFYHELRYQVPHHLPHAQGGALRHLPSVLDTDGTGTGATNLVSFSVMI
jgi:hypothetical protein